MTFTDFGKLRSIIESLGVDYVEMTQQRMAELWTGELIGGINDVIVSSQGLFDVLPDGSVIRVIVHAPQGPYSARDLPELERLNSPERGWHKFHIFWCSVVKRWTNRLRKTNRNDGKFTYPVFWQNGSEYQPELRDGGRALRLCSYCATALRSLGYPVDPAAFDVTEFLERKELGARFHGVWFSSDFDLVPNVYSEAWARISSDFKTMRNWTCERCYLDLSDSKHRRFLHAHHRDHHKANNSIFNLQALCIRCHAKEHPHVSALNQSRELAAFCRSFPNRF